MPPGITTLAADAPTLSAANTGFMLICSALVMLMTPGLAFFYGGMVRVKSTLNMLMMSFISLGIVTILWVLYGFSLAFGTDSGSLIGWSSDYVGLQRHRPHRAVGRLHHPGLRLRRLPADVRDHHPGADQRRPRRPREVHRLGAVHRPVGHRRLLPGRALGLGRRRLALRARRHRLRRRYRRPHQRRCRGPRRDPGHRQARRLQEGPDAAAQPAAGDARRRSAVVRLVRLQRRLLARQRRRRRRGRCSSTPRSPPPPPCSAGSAYEKIRHGSFTTLGAASGAVAGLVAITPSGGCGQPARRDRRSASSPVCSAPWPSA